jgi:hypothetical protein
VVVYDEDANSPLVILDRVHLLHLDRNIRVETETKRATTFSEFTMNQGADRLSQLSVRDQGPIVPLNRSRYDPPDVVSSLTLKHLFLCETPFMKNVVNFFSA